MSRCYAGLIPIFLSLFFSRVSFAASVEVRAISGKVKYWPSWTSGWRILKEGQTIPKNSLVLVGENSTFTYIPLDQTLGFGEISINRPMTFRLDGKEVRKVRVESNFVESLPDLEGLMGVKVDASSAVKSESSLGQAWNKVVVMAAKPFGSSQKGEVNNEQKSAASGQVGGTQLQAVDRNIKMIYPRQKSVATSTLPHKMDLVWKSKDYEDTINEIWLKRGDGESRLIDRTKSSRYSLTLNSYGDYSVEIKVKSKSGIEAAKTFEFAVQEPLAITGRDVISGIEGDSKASSFEDQLIPLTELSPPAGLNVLTQELPYQVHFYWQPQYLPQGEYHQEWVLLNEDGVEIRRQFVKSGYGLKHSFTKHGNYQWFIEFRHGNGNQILTSRKSLFQILSQNFSLDSFSKGTIYLESGLKNL